VYISKIGFIVSDKMAQASYYPFIRVENKSDGDITAWLCDGSHALITGIQPVQVSPGTTGNLELPEKTTDINWNVDYPMNDVLNGRFIKFEFADGTIKFYATANLNAGRAKMDVVINEDMSIAYINEARSSAFDLQKTIRHFIKTGTGGENLDDEIKHFLLLGAVSSGDFESAKRMGFTNEQIEQAKYEVENLDNMELE